MAIQLKRPAEVEGLREAGRIVAGAFAMLRGQVRPGVSLRELDQRVTDFLAEQGAEPLYKGYRGRPASHPPFPGVICASVNSEICHGLPDARVLRSGDIVGIDIGLKYQGWCGDSCVTFAVGTAAPGTDRLLAAAEEAMWQGVNAAQSGHHLSDIGAAIQAYAEAQGYSVVYDWGGHGTGQSPHEDPPVPARGPGAHGPGRPPGARSSVERLIHRGAPPAP